MLCKFCFWQCKRRPTQYAENILDIFQKFYFAIKCAAHLDRTLATQFLNYMQLLVLFLINITKW